MSPPKTKKPLQTGGSDAAVADTSALNLGIQCSYDNMEKELAQHFTPKKANSVRLADAYLELSDSMPALMKRAQRVSGCGDFLEFHVSEQKTRLAVANFCKDRLCPMCNWRRSLKIFGQMSKVMDVLQGDGYRFLFLTLTVKNCSGDDLRAVLDDMQKAWTRMMHLKVFKSVVCGTFRAVEVTRNRRTGLYHPHYHVVIAVRPDYFKHGYIPQAEWKKFWRESCRLQYDPVVDIRTIKADTDKDLKKAVAESSKYPYKDTDLLRGSMPTVKNNVRVLLDGLTQRKLCSWTGCFLDALKKLNLDEDDDGDLLHVGDDEDLRDDVSYLIVRWHWKAGAYISGEMQYMHVKRIDL